MKIKVLLLFASLCCSVLSCVKTAPADNDVPDTPDNDGTVQIRKISVESDNAGGSYIFRYDSKGRLVQTEFTGWDEAPAYILSYLYATDYVRASSDSGDTYMYELDDKGQVAGVAVDGDNDYRFDVHFDDAGHMESVVPSEKWLIDNGTNCWNATMSDGNCIAFDCFSLQYSNHPNDYSIDLNRVLYDIFDGFQFFKDLNFLRFQGISSKNLISGISVTGSFECSVSYSFDDNGRVMEIHLNAFSTQTTIQIEY